MVYNVWTAKFKSSLSRITVSRVATAFFLVTIVQTVVQLALQSVALRDDVLTARAAHAILEQAPENDLCRAALPIVDGSTLRICDRVPTLPGAICDTVVNLLSPRGFEVSSLTSRDEDVAHQCQRAMVLPKEIFTDAKRADIVTLFYQVWLLVIAIAAILNDSIPYMVAQLLGHTLNTGWAAFRVQRIRTVQRAYSWFVVEGACGGVDVINESWKNAMAHSIAVVTFSATMLFATGVFSIILLRRYMRETFNRVGTSPQITQVYKLSMLFSVSLHGSFFLLAAAYLWLAKLITNPFSGLTRHVHAYEALVATTIAVIPIWVLLGHYSVCLECSRRFGGFMLLGAFVFAERIAAFTKPEFRFLFGFDPFFATVSVAAFTFLVLALILIVVCRMNYGKGLKQYIAVQTLLARDGFAPGIFRGSSIGSASAHTSWLHHGTELGLPQIFPDANPVSPALSEKGKLAEAPINPTPIIISVEPASVQTPPPLSTLSLQVQPASQSKLLVPPGLSPPPRVAFNSRRAVVQPFPSQPRASPTGTPSISASEDRLSDVSCQRTSSFSGRRDSSSTSGTFGQISRIISGPRKPGPNESGWF